MHACPFKKTVKSIWVAIQSLPLGIKSILVSFIFFKLTYYSVLIAGNYEVRLAVILCLMSASITYIAWTKLVRFDKRSKLS